MCTCYYFCTVPIGNDEKYCFHHFTMIFLDSDKFSVNKMVLVFKIFQAVCNWRGSPRLNIFLGLHALTFILFRFSRRVRRTKLYVCGTAGLRRSRRAFARLQARTRKT